MRFSDITGFSDIKEAFVSMVDRDKVPHAIMLYENDGGGAMPLALALIQYMSCTDRRDGDSCGECRSCRQNEKLIWPDVHFSFPVTSGNIVKKEVKDITSPGLCRTMARDSCWTIRISLEKPRVCSLGIRSVYRAP